MSGEIIRPINVPTKPIKLSKDKAIKESAIENNGYKYCATKGVMFEKFVTPNKRSVPDRILTFPNGLIAFIEYKAPGKRATDLQFKDHQRRREHGCLVYVVDDVFLSREIIDFLLDLDSSPDSGRAGWYAAEECIANKNHYPDKNCIGR